MKEGMVGPGWLMRSPSAVRLPLVAAALLALGAGPAWAAGPGGGAGPPDKAARPDPEGPPPAWEPKPDEPEVEPPDRADDVEPDPDATLPSDDRSPPPEDTPFDGAPPAPVRKLPPKGLGERPAMPHIDRDLIHPEAGIVGQAQAQIDLSRVGEDLFVVLNLGTVLVHRDWRIAPRLPLRLRVVDEAPHTNAIVREQDWDEPSDFARLIAFFQYGGVGEPLYLRYGELTGVVVGHGSIVNRYFNTVDIDHYQGGAYFFGDVGLLGGEILVDNLFDPNVVIGRPWVRPLDWLPFLPFFLQKVKVGLTVGADFAAPLAVARDEAGRVLQDDQFRARVTGTDAIPMLGLDLEVPVVSTPHVDVVPYADVATIDTEGVGVHIGTYLNLRFTPLMEWRNRIEYRHQGPGYQAGYVSPFYEIERLSMRDQLTKLAFLRGGGFGSARNGFYYETEFDIVSLLRFMLVVADDEGPDNTDVLMRLHLPHLGPFRLALFFARLGFDGVEDFLSADRTVAAAALRWNILDMFFVRGSVKNEWWLRHAAGRAGKYETTFDWDVGFGLLIKL
jgi:hypothetical protein